MARSWRDYRAAETPADACDNRDNRDNSPPNVPNVTNVTDAPALVRDGLARLAGAPVPRFVRAELWPGVVADAQRLESEGWALSALQLGWSPLELFGALTGKGGDADCDGLAVRLAGRQLLAICASFATVRDPNNGRSYLYRGSTEGARLLWELGRGR